MTVITDINQFCKLTTFENRFMTKPLSNGYFNLVSIVRNHVYIYPTNSTVDADVVSDDNPIIEKTIASFVKNYHEGKHGVTVFDMMQISPMQNTKFKNEEVMYCDNNDFVVYSLSTGTVIVLFLNERGYKSFEVTKNLVGY